ncbi:putative Ankyrin-3 [Nannochloris sp. 'desiccata']|nr:putative Ankyrin-3 [Chlorella desiccata (nom. nud.)]
MIETERDPQYLLVCARLNSVPEVVNLVRVHNIPVDYGNLLGQTALHIAALHGNVETVKILLLLGDQSGVPGFVNIQNRRGQTPLHFAAAAKKNAFETCELLVANGAHRLLEDSLGCRPYENANDTEVRALIGPDRRIFEYAALGDLPNFEALLEEIPDHGVDLYDSTGNAPLHLAAAGNHTDLIVYLCSTMGSYVNMQNMLTGESCLHLVAGNDSDTKAAARTIEVLASLGADPNIRNFSNNQYSDGTWMSGSETVSMFDKTPLHVAVAAANIEAIQALLNIPEIDVNIEDASKETPLYYATEMQDEVILEMLLEHGCDVFKCSTSHATSILAAASSGWARGLDLMLDASDPVNDETDAASLIKNGGDISKSKHTDPARVQSTLGNIINSDADGWTPLMLAVRGGKLSAAQLLLRRGADPNIVNPKTGASVYHLAATKGREDLCRMLVDSIDKEHRERGLRIRNKDGRLPKEMAMSPAIASLFESPAACA